jgi:anaerobic magnesium-protoporphyrin IX monomethyl ester cyclase
MNVILISPPHKNTISTTIPDKINKERGLEPPLGLLYVASRLKQNRKHVVTIIDSDAEGLDYSSLEQRISRSKPDIVGIQVLTFTLLDALQTASVVKNISKSISVVFGGPHVTIYPTESLMYKDVDYIVRGEGEISFNKMLDGIESGASLSAIDGIGFKKNGNLTITKEPVFIDDLNSMPFPDRTLLPYKKYYSLLSRNFPITTMMTSRGCPYNCIFCKRMGKKFRAISAQKVVEEIEHCLNIGIKEIFFYDDTFTIDNKRVFEICDLINKKGLKFYWNARARVDTVDYDLLLAMKRAGCKRISFGVESGNPAVLKNLKKGITLKQAMTVFGFARNIRIETLADFMIGSPGETRQHIMETIRFARKLKTDYAQFSLTVPYPGTALYEEALANGIIKSDVWREFARNPRSDFTSPLWTEYLSRFELIDLLGVAYRKFYLSPKFIIREVFNIRSSKEFFTKVKAVLKLFKK